MKKYYEKHDPKNCTLRDHLAADRTVLSSERTLLAYIRTSLTAIVAGITLIKFFEGVYFQSTGWGFIAIGIVIIIFGVRRYMRQQRKLRKFLD